MGDWRADIWTEGDVAKLKEAFASMLSGSEIGRLLNRSRSAIMGKLWRMGLHRKSPDTAHLNWQARRIHEDKKRKQRQRIGGAVGNLMANNARMRRRRLRPHPSLVGRPAPGYTGVNLLDLERVHCHYPIDRSDGVFYCGAPTIDENSSWCAHHHALCTLPRRHSYSANTP